MDIVDEFKPGASHKTQKPSDGHIPRLEKNPEHSKMFSVSSVLTFMIAVGFAHFLIVVGGFSGSLGYAKLEAAQAWVASLSN